MYDKFLHFIDWNLLINLETCFLQEFRTFSRVTGQSLVYLIL